ncbi:TetR family transcriptional regulator [Marmoricola endophyticus]|uniref:TetR family transcriptional regulator n=1 Tax=Marmoricola endophyticus TaxID=2040280 RepID=A0A917BJX1_9ACTN|nr:TetR/AcrR family transcriptional regulator [Marmoricola endophyticus]GGF48252.1 TetR family transcriptional regulator [Marmoricola endophyticus]
MTDTQVQRGRATEQAIREAALSCFSERGYHGASIRFIADRAGTSLSNVYNYVASKDELLAQLLRRASEAQYAQVLEALDGAGEDPAERLRAAVEAYARYVIEHRDELVLSNTEFRYLSRPHRTEVVELRDRMQRLVDDLIEDGVRRGAFATPYPADVSRSLLTMVSNITAWFQPEGALSATEVARRHAGFALALVEAG